MTLKDRFKKALPFIIPCIVLYIIFEFFAWIILVLPIVVFIKPNFLTTKWEDKKE